MRRFGVEVKPGKGSEKKLFRAGHPMQTIASHGEGSEVSLRTIKIACDKLGIAWDEFWQEAN